MSPRLRLVAYCLPLLSLTLAVETPDATAGPPLICWQIDIGDEPSLPWGDGPFGVRKDYDLDRLVPDTLRLFEGKVSMLVRMETLRRATIYASPHGKGGARGRAAIWELTARLMAEVLDWEAKGVAAEPAWVVVGYLVASCAQADLGTGFDGYAWARKAKAFLAASPEAQFALALMTAMGEGNREAHEGHVKAALDGATEGSLLAKNLVTHLGGGAATLDEMRKRHAGKRD